VTTDVLSVSCPRCRAKVLHQEAQTRHRGLFERIDQPSDGEWELEIVYVFDCGICQMLWPVLYTTASLSFNEVRSWLEVNPVRRLGVRK
jgi:hypothetical protein